MGLSLEFTENKQFVEANKGSRLQKKLLLIESEHYLSQVFFVNDSYCDYQTKKIAMGLKISEELESYLLDHRPDMILLDIGFVDIEELRLISDLRQIYDGFIIVVTSNNSEEEHFTAFDLGADDYLLKTINTRILMKHIDALFRRQKDKTSNVELASIKVGDVCLQPNSQKCFINGEVVKLTTFEFNLLKSLIEHEGNILTRNHLYTSLLRREYNGVERTLDVRMSQLREKLTMAGMKDNQIETVWGQGYMLNHINS